MFFDTTPFTIVLLIASFFSIIIVGAVVGGAKSHLGPKPRAKERQYTPQGRLFSQGEQAFFNALTQAVGKDHRVFGKVRIADVIKPRAEMSQSEWGKAFGPICAKHFDFVICSADGVQIQAVVELDDRSHQHVDREKRDALVDAVCHDAGVPIVHVKAARRYDRASLRALIDAAIHKGQSTFCKQAA